MKYLPFESRDELYKKPFGAVADKEEVTLRLLLHDDARCTGAFVRYRRDGEAAETAAMLPAGRYDEHFRWYEVRLSFDEGLYWYSFFFNSDYGTKQITRFKNGEGIISPDGDDWQLTVYERDFKAPKDTAGGIIYQIFPDRFYCSGSSKSNVPTDRFIRNDRSAVPEYRQNVGPCSLGNDYYGGDLAGIKEKLPYLASLGVSIIYLNPIFEAHSNHRYNTADYMKIDPLLGSEEDFKELCAAAANFSIKIILDGVFSHTGDDSVYFNRYKRYDSCGAYNSTSSPYFGWFKFTKWPDSYSAWWGVPSLPETHEDNKDFSEFITGENGVLRHWLRLGAGGWRLDVADELPDRFLDKIRSSIKAENPDALIIGEVWEDATDKISYGVRRRYLRGRQLDSVMNYPFAAAIVRYVTGGNGDELCDTVMTICENYPKTVVDVLMNHIGTHDTARILTVLGGEPEMGRGRAWQSAAVMNEGQLARGKKLLYIAALLQFTLPGIPSVYYGDEAGMTGYGDPFCRGFYPWGKEDMYLVSFYKTLGRIRRSSPAFKDGSFRPVHTALGLFAFVRECDTEKILIAANRWHENDSFYAGNEWDKAEALFGRKASDGTVTVEALGFTVLRLQKGKF